VEGGRTYLDTSWNQGRVIKEVALKSSNSRLLGQHISFARDILAWALDLKKERSKALVDGIYWSTFLGKTPGA
jgi:hypothetical protein